MTNRSTRSKGTKPTKSNDKRSMARSGSTQSKGRGVKQQESDSFYERLVYWKQEKLKKIKQVRREERTQQNKALVFRPDIQKSTTSINKVHAGLAQGQDLQEMKGVQVHLQRIQEAQRKRLEDAQVFLLPSERAKLKGKAQK